GLGGAFCRGLGGRGRLWRGFGGLRGGGGDGERLLGLALGRGGKRRDRLRLGGRGDGGLGLGPARERGGALAGEGSGRGGDAAGVLVRERGEEDAQRPRVGHLPGGGAAGAGERRLGGGVDAGAERALLARGQGPAEIDAALDGGQIDHALLDQIGE